MVIKISCVFSYAKISTLKHVSIKFLANLLLLFSTIYIPQGAQEIHVDLRRTLAYFICMPGTVEPSAMIFIKMKLLAPLILNMYGN